MFFSGSEADTNCSAKRRCTEKSENGEASCSLTPSPPATSVQPAESSDRRVGVGSRDSEDDDGSTSYVLGRLALFLSPTEQFILDIDLDFFSCKNPFKELYTKVQMFIFITFSHQVFVKIRCSLILCVFAVLL